MGKWPRCVLLFALNSLKNLVQLSSSESSVIGVHCLAGLGRAPVLVVIALIEHGMKNLDAVELVRSKRRGMIWEKQTPMLLWLPLHNEDYCILHS